MARRIVVKVGTSSLTDERGRIYPPHLWAIARGLQVLEDAWDARAVLVSSGAGAAGREQLGLNLPLTLPDKQAAAAVGQGLLMLDWARAFAPKPVAQLLLTASDIQHRERYVNAKSALDASLKHSAVPIINENDSVATHEIKLGDNDTLSAWAAYLVGADTLIILTDVDGLYDKDPRKFADARKLEHIKDVNTVTHLAGSAGTQRGTGGMVTKLRAASIAAAAGIETRIMAGGGPGLEALAAGEARGTRILASPGYSARKAWLAQQPSKGTIFVDAGAQRALEHGRSLLPKGVTGLAGNFQFGDAVAVMQDNVKVAQGLSNYSSDALARIRGQHTQAISALLGYKDYDEVIHRDNLVLMTS